MLDTPFDNIRQNIMVITLEGELEGILEKNWMSVGAQWELDIILELVLEETLDDYWIDI
jgi:hypothetical protein